jgi:hypothetical protein
MTNKTLTAVAVAPLVIVIGWSVGLSLEIGPATGWMLNAVVAYPLFIAILVIIKTSSKFFNLGNVWLEAISCFAWAVVVSAVYHYWIFAKIYSTYQLGRIVVVENSHLTNQGTILVLEWALRDGVLFVLAFALFVAIRRTRVEPTMTPPQR